MFQIDLLISFRLRFGVNKEMCNLFLLMFHQNHEFSITAFDQFFQIFVTFLSKKRDKTFKNHIFL